MTLPQWTPPEDVSDPVREAWQRYISALEAHERGHAQIAQASVAELHRRVAAIGLAENPLSLRAEVERVVETTLQEFRERDRNYDELTDHGIKQGATLTAGASMRPRFKVARGFRAEAVGVQPTR
jgi:predicted secreted Zn-dependent protease